MNLDELRSKWLDLKHSVLDKWDDLRANPRKLIIAASVTFFVLGVGVGYMNKAHAAFYRGQVLEHALSVCLKKEDAIAVVAADSENGLAVAIDIWQSKECAGPVPVVGLTVGEVVFSAKVKRDGKELTMQVVEILGLEGKPIGYFMSSDPVHDKKLLALKPERNVSLDLDAIWRDYKADRFQPGGDLAHLAPSVIAMLAHELRQ